MSHFAILLGFGIRGLGFESRIPNPESPKYIGDSDARIKRAMPVGPPHALPAFLLEDLAGAQGRVAFSDGEWAFLHMFELETGATYPDGGATVEVWTHGPGLAAGVNFGQPQLRGEFMEMEVLGPLKSLSPGEQASSDLIWAACRCPGQIVDATPHGCVGEPLALSAYGGLDEPGEELADETEHDERDRDDE